MKKNLNGKIAAIVAVLVICVYGIFGVPSGVSGKALMDAMSKRIHLGLDLRGGVHLILQVMVAEAVSAETDNTVGRIQQDLKTADLSFSQVYKPDPAKPEIIRVEGAAAGKSSDTRSLLESKYANQYDVTGGGAETSFTLTMKPNMVTTLEDKTVQQAIETIRDRVDTLGVSEPKIEAYGLGKYQILVELPGIDDLDRVKSIIQSTARLEIHAVIGGPFKDDQEALASVNGSVPPDQMLVHGAGEVSASAESESVWLLHRVSVVAGQDFRSAEPNTDQNTGQREVSFTLTNEAGDKFHDYTSANVGQRMAVVMGGRVKEVATIQSPIRDTGRITGSFSPDEVMILSKMLKSGALPASLTYLEDRTIGASLGADSIKEGVNAAIAGVVVVMVFMLFYYRGSGINADLALIMNLIILLGVLGFWGAALTLPGIAGVILTIGMGVDSNVLIFERIREEVRAGKAAAAAVDQGFAHAWITIVDTHVTTIVSAAILFVFGSGPVRGFATTLTVGLAANLFTAVFVSRVIFDAHLNRMKPGELVSI